ncbi:ATP-binding protein [Erysipelotrichaceae bacterium OH741_COT-311]|nr:ATP-binding protein [Erysipelotrichaceae bacterium OH741_COT-311]
MFEINSGKIAKAQKIVVYGPEGIGKSTFASKFPNALFIDVEDSTNNMEVRRLPKPTSWAMLLQEIEYVKNNCNLCTTLVIDTADWTELLCIDNICQKMNIKGIEDMGYGKGYVYLAEEFGRLLNKLSELIPLGINVVFTAHAMMRKFEQPDEIGAYDRWELKLQKKTAPLLKEWADMILFANYKTVVVNVDNQGAAKGKNKAQGGRRIMYTSHHPCWDAKNRHGLPEELEFDYKHIEHIILSGTFGLEIEVVEDKPKTTEIKVEKPTQTTKPIQAQKQMTEEESEFNFLPKALQDLMLANDVTVSDLKDIAAKKGYVTRTMLFKNYPKNFIEGAFIGAWDQVLKAINEAKQPVLDLGQPTLDISSDDLPF